MKRPGRAADGRRGRGRPQRTREERDATGIFARGLAVVLILAVVGSVAVLLWRRGSVDDPPRADLTEAQAPVKQAVEAAIGLTELQPKSVDAWAELAMVYHAHGYTDEALAAYRRAESLAPEDPRWPYLIGLLLSDEDAELAASEIERGLDLGIDFSSGHWNLGNLRLDLGQLEDAKAQFARAVELDAGSPHAHAGLGRAQLLLGQPAAAVESLTRAIELDPEFADAHTFLSQALARLGQDEAADRHADLAEMYGGGIAIGPADPVFVEVVNRGVSVRWLSRKARGMAAEGRPAEAEALFRQALEADPENPEALVGLGVILQDQGDLAEARELYERALATDAENLQALNNLGQLLRQSGDLQGAAQAFERALTIDDRHVESRLNFATMRLEQGQPEAAARLARGVLEQAPFDITALNIVGDAESSAGKVEAAIEAYRASTDLDPLQEQAWLNWAQTHIDAGQHAEAITVLRGAEAVLPASVPIRALLAWELATAPDASNSRDGDEALALAESVVDSRPEIVAGWDILAAARAESGQFEAAIDAAETALRKAREQGGTAAIPEIEARLDGYRAGRPYRQVETP